MPLPILIRTLSHPNTDVCLVIELGGELVFEEPMGIAALLIQILFLRKAHLANESLITRTGAPLICMI